jgi:hypothetical protein
MKTTTLKMILAGVVFALEIVVATPSKAVELTLVDSESMPETATFFFLSHLEPENEWPPLPFSTCPTCPTYWIDQNKNVLLVDDSEQMLTSGGEFSMESNSMDPCDGDCGTNEGSGWEYTSPVYTTNDLWVSITGRDTNSVETFVAHPPWNELTNSFDLFATTNLSANVAGLNATNWVWLFRTVGGLTNFSVSNLTDTVCYFQLARTNDDDSDLMSTAFELRSSHTDWTVADENTNSILDGWEWDYFGSLQPGDSDFDGDGRTNYEEYQSGSDPNSMSFDVEFTGYRINANGATGTFDILGGVPSKMAVLLDSTNFSGAAWVPYNSNVLVNLGSTDGKHMAWIGLKGRAAAATYVWRGMEFTRDTTSPAIAITNPLTTTLSKPVIQLKGYSIEPLTTIRYDVTNTAGLLTNQPGYVTTQWFDTNVFDFTTNWFACEDVALALGTNVVTLRTTDDAGNVSTNVVTYVLNYSSDTTPPVITLDWPRNGLEICGELFSANGRLDDETAKLSAHIVNSNGITNSVNPLVQRSGEFWADNFPLASGTNYLTLIATDTAGNSSVTNITVIKGSLAFVMTGYSGDLWDPTVTVYGSISDTNYAVWVNGIHAAVETDGSWTANDVPVTEGGRAAFEMTAYAPGEPQP